MSNLNLGSLCWAAFLKMGSLRENSPTLGSPWFKPTIA